LSYLPEVFFQTERAVHTDKAGQTDKASQTDKAVLTERPFQSEKRAFKARREGDSNLAVMVNINTNDSQMLPPIGAIAEEEREKNIKRPRIEEHCYNPDDHSAACSEEETVRNFKLPASKSPIMEAMVVCAINGWGIDIIRHYDIGGGRDSIPNEILFKVTDFNRYYRISRAICSKQRPTDDLGSRIKALKRWFVNFPKKKYCCENSFCLVVKPKIIKKVNDIIERNTRFLEQLKKT